MKPPHFRPIPCCCQDCEKYNREFEQGRCEFHDFAIDVDAAQFSVCDDFGLDPDAVTD